MATSFTSLSSARYLVVVRHLDGSEAPFKVFCDTVAEVRQAVRRSLTGMELIARSAGKQVYVSRKASDIYASAISYQDKRNVRFLVAQGAGMDMDVILLR